MILVGALVVMIVSGWMIAGFTSDALKQKGRWVWLAVPAGVVGAVLFCWVAMIGPTYFSFLMDQSRLGSFVGHVFMAWVVTSWAGLLGVPVVLAIAIRVVTLEPEDQE